MSHLSALKLQNFRNYQSARLDRLDSGFVVLYGTNGAGKTNILEAVSLLTPGRGLRTAKVMELQSNQAGQPWAVAADLETSMGQVKLGTGLDGVTEKRVVRINGQSAKGQSALGQHLAAVWLTPQMDRLFLDSSSQRRRFFDRLIFAFDAAHVGRLNRYDNALSQRSKILKEAASQQKQADTAWLAGLEKQIVETGCAIAAARLSFVERLQAACLAGTADGFPVSRLSLRGTVEELLLQSSALEVEDLFAYHLKQSRTQDGFTGGAATGPHKTDLHVVYADKKMPADQCSTGEQKALLIGIVIAHAKLIAAERGAPPLLLLDEVAAHLDEKRRADLYSILEALGGQVWLTGTELDLFAELNNKAQFIKISDDQVWPQPIDVAAAS